jgi:hypothetical protein
MKTLQSLSLIFLIVFFYSCSTKKVITATDITKTKIDSSYKEKKDSVSVIQNSIEINEKLFEIQIDAIDVAKPILVDGVRYENASLKIKKYEKLFVDSTKTTVSESVDKKFDLEKEVFVKEIDRSLDKKSSNQLYFWLLLIFVLAYASYKFRRLIPNPYSIIRYICQTLKNQIK